MFVRNTSDLNKNIQFSNGLLRPLQPQRGSNHADLQSTATTSLGLVNVPKVKSQLKSETATSNNAVVSKEKTENQFAPKKFGATEKEKICVLSGTVERIVRYGKIFQNHLFYFQVIGNVISIAEGKIPCEKTMLLRDKNKGPVLKVIYYLNATHMNIDDFYLGQCLRAIGRMIGPNLMSAITIRAATTEEQDILPRLCCVSDYAVSALCNGEEV